MPSRSFRYERLPYLELGIQAEDGPQVAFIGTVSTRVPRTVLSTDAAEQLGIGPGDLREAGAMTLIDLREVPSWMAAKPIRGLVHTQSSPDGPLEPWGPIFELAPIFIENGSPVWGGDFLDSFSEIAFNGTSPVKTFTLTYRAGLYP